MLGAVVNVEVYACIRVARYCIVKLRILGNAHVSSSDSREDEYRKTCLKDGHSLVCNVEFSDSSSNG